MFFDTAARHREGYTAHKNHGAIHEGSQVPHYYLA